MPAKRIEFIDLAKGLCISLVLLYHIHDFETNVERALLFFRMPLYYFLSGIFFKDYSGFIDFSIRKINKLIVPYLFFFLAGYIAGMIGYFLHFYEKGIVEEPFRWNMIFDVFTKLGRGENIGYNAPIWFLISLFEVNIMFYLLKILIKNNAALLVACFCIGLVATLWVGALPYFGDYTLKALPFFAGGYMAKKWLINPVWKKKIYFLIAVIGFAFIYSCAILPLHIRTSFIVTCLAGFVGIFMILSISQVLQKLPLISYIGRYSLIVLGFHTFLVGPFKTIYAFASPVGAYVLTFFSILILMRCVVIPISVKVFPFFTAQKDLIKWP